MVFKRLLLFSQYESHIRAVNIVLCHIDGTKDHLLPLLFQILVPPLRSRIFLSRLTGFSPAENASVGLSTKKIFPVGSRT